VSTEKLKISGDATAKKTVVCVLYPWFSW